MTEPPNKKIQIQIPINQQIQDENIHCQNKQITAYNQANELQKVSSNININSINKLNQSQISVSIQASKSVSKREQAQKQDKRVIAVVKKAKIIIDNFKQYIPQLFILLSQLKPKPIIRIGRNYQADVPRKCKFSYKYRPMNQLKLWSPGEFQPNVLKKFRQKFGQNRTQQDLCLLLYQYQCDWSQINTYVNQYKGQLRKSYLVRDRTRIS